MSLESKASSSIVVPEDTLPSLGREQRHHLRDGLGFLGADALADADAAVGQGPFQAGAGEQFSQGHAQRLAARAAKGATSSRRRSVIRALGRFMGWGFRSVGRRPWKALPPHGMRRS